MFMNEFSPLTAFLIHQSVVIFLIVVALLVAVWAVIASQFVKRSISHNEPLWKSIRAPLFIALLPLLASWHIWFDYQDILNVVCKTGCVILISIGLFSAFLRYKGLFSFKLLRSLIIGHCIGCAVFFTAFFGFSKGYDFLLNQDPDFRKAIALFEQRQKERALKVDPSVSSPVALAP